ANASGLCIGIDRNRPNPSHFRALVEEVASDNPTIELSYNRIEMGMRNEKSHQPRCNIRGWEIRRKIVPLGDAFEGFKTDPSALRRVSRYTATQIQIHVLFVPIIRCYSP